MGDSTKTAALVGRQAETAQIDALLERAPAGGGALLVSGEAGIGKSSLLAGARTRALAAGFRVLHTAGVEPEASLPFAGLHRLLLPVLDRAQGLPGPQRDALLAAFGVTGGSVPDLFLVAMATLNLLTEATADGAPVLIVADDVHWLDRPSADVLGFVARRLEFEPVLLVAAVRDGWISSLSDTGIDELHLEPLSDGEADALLTLSAPKLAPHLRQRLIRHAAGNPLALVELPVALRPEQLLADASVPVVLPLTKRLERAFAARFRDLPASTRTALLVAAVDERGDAGEILAAAGRLDSSAAMLAVLSPAADAGLVRLEAGEVVFRHPLVRSAVFHGAGETARLAVHGALAAVLEDQPERRLWHRAAATLGHDDEIGDALAAAAARAKERGAVEIAVQWLERAAHLAAAREVRVERLLGAATLAFELGRPVVVQRLVEAAMAGELTVVQRARAEWLSEIFHDGRPGDPTRVRALLRTAGEVVQAGDLDLGIALLQGAGLRSWWADPGRDVRMELIAAVEALPPGNDDPRLLATLGMAGPIERAAVVQERLDTLGSLVALSPEQLLYYGMAAQAVGDFPTVIRLLEGAADGFRAEGRLGLLTHALGMRAWSAIDIGDFHTARPVIEELEVVAFESNQPIWAAGARIGEALLCCMRGEPELAEAHVLEGEQVLLPGRISNLLAIVQFAKGVIALSAARYEDAYRELARMFDRDDVAFHYRELYQAVGYFAEAGARTGRREEVRAILDELELLDPGAVSPGLRMAREYALPILAGDDDAEALFRAALDSPDTGFGPFVRARMQLAYGTWLRRQRRVTESREPLRAARDGFDRLRALPWSELARNELRASGETSRQRPEWAWDQLTAQERQIAQLAAEGLTNREIGERLYLSHRTISSHLYRIYPKLGITSRAQLAKAIES